jgi:hypothetical protein
MDTTTIANQSFLDQRNVFNPEYNNTFTVQEDKYMFMSHCYEGNGGYHDGTYLFPFLRESFYISRKAQAFYRNFIKPIINSLVDPVFGAPIVRTINNNLYNSFILNCDGVNTLDEFCKDVAILSRLHGNVFVVMDNFTKEEIPLLEKDAILQRKHPFVYIQPAYTVSEYKTNKLNQLESITFKGCIVIDGKTLNKYTTWDSQDTIIVIKDGDKVISTEINTHNLGIVPVLQVNSIDKCDILPTPGFYDVGKLNLAIYNKDSEIRDQERAQAFSIFYMQTDVSNTSVTIGPHNAILIPAGNDITITPGYASPDSSILTVLMANNNALIESLFKIAESNGVVGIKEVSSGVAESYRFYSQNIQLIKTANLMESFEYRLLELFGKYIGQDIEGIIRYTKEFSPVISKENIENSIKLLSMEFGPEVKDVIKEQLLRSVLNYMDKDELDSLIDNDKINSSGSL